MARFDKISAKQETSLPEPAPTTNGTTKHAGRASSSMSPTKRKATSSASPQNDDDDDLSDVADSPRPSKKAKKSKAVETDEQIAKRMQAELNAPNARSTRGGGSGKKKAVVKKATGTPSKTKTKKKSKAKIRSEDDSEVESGSEDDKPAKQRTGGFHVRRNHHPSPHHSN